MGVNKIARIFPDTEWRPTHYVKVDHSMFEDEQPADQISPVAECGAKMLLLSQFQDTVGDAPNITWVDRCKHHFYPPGHEQAAQSWHMPEYCTAHNSISLMAQWAVLLGYDEIYLLGCDLDYTDGNSDHFVEGYYHNVDWQYKERNESYALYAHQVIRRSSPVTVYNATLGGALEVHPRVDLLQVLGIAEHQL